jgi:hypothetical protein
MNRTFAVAAALAAAMLAAACGGSSSKNGGSSSGLSVPVSGVVYSEATGGAAASPASGVKVTASAGAATASATTGTDGAFSLTVSVPNGTQLLVTFEQAGAAKLARTFRIYSSTPVTASATMRPLTSLSCDTAGGCQLDSGKLTVGNLDPGTSGKARVFNPATEITAFPGSFSDSAGNLLISGVFSALEMKTPAGAALTVMPMRMNTATAAVQQSAADLKMEVPKETWPSVRDMTPSGDNVIVVPLYAFNETTGEWQYQSDGELVDSSGATIPPSQLAAIRAQTFTGPIFARGQVTHFSWWNVDWPVQTHGCITGRILDAAGRPAVGAVVTVSLASPNHNGTSQPVTVGADGKFCLESLRSEAPGEDVDGDGVPGEIHKVVVRVTYGGALYDLGVHEMPSANGTCGASGACLALGDLTLNDATKLTAKRCTLQGTVRKDGVPQAGVMVWGWDESLPWELFSATCGVDQSSCLPFAGTDPEGAYTVVVPMIGGAQVSAWWFADTGFSWRWGTQSVPAPTPSCPAGPFDIDLNQGFDWVTLAVTVQAGQLTWSPPDGTTLLAVQTFPAGAPKWLIEANTGVSGFASPVTYGVVPAGAVQIWPDPGSASPTPAAVAACDEVSMLGQGYSGGIYRLDSGDCVLIDLSGVLTCLPKDDARVSSACGTGQIDPGTAATIVGTWLGDTDVSNFTPLFSGYPKLVINGNGTYSIDFDSNGTVEVAGTYTWSGSDLAMQDTSGSEACLGAGTAGTYTPDLYTSGGSSSLSLMEQGTDPCAGRSAMLGWEYWTQQSGTVATAMTRWSPASSSIAAPPRVLRFPTLR